ncbi:MAG: asparagine synthase (glutamine-hydrolyzing), partial [Flavisolibacter sp.]
KILFAARDRFGEKPFYFFYDDEQLAFGSEMKTLWRFGLEKEVNTSMIYNFITIGYSSNPSAPEETFFKNISKLPAANYLVYHQQSHQLVVENYWQLYLEPPRNISDQEAISNFDRLFSESLRKRLRSDVEIGTSLSGGLDSSSIVAYAESLASSQYRHQCFTAVFNDFDKNEFEQATLVAKKFQLRHHIVEMDQEDLPALMQKVMYHQEEPFSSGSVLAQFKVYEAAKANGVTVLLDGQGADEVLGGYHKYFKWYWQELYRKGQLKKSGELKSAQNLGVNEAFGTINKIAALVPEFAAGILQTRKSRKAFRHPGLNRDFAYAHKRELYYATPTHADLNGVLFFNTFMYGLEELLKLADRNSMSHATEVRLPFLNHELVEFLFSLPPSFKIRDGRTKWLLRKTVENKLPPAITWRKDKTGFEPPQKTWMQIKNVQESIMAGKKKMVDAGILDAAVLKKNQPHSSYAADGVEWRYWSASFLY